MKKIYCYSHPEFDLICHNQGWNDFNIPENSAFISIIGTKECQDHYLNEKEDHWFSSGKSNQVLNLEFDDISNETFSWKGHIFNGISSEQAKEVVDFIDSNINCDFYIHCRAGRSRSQGIVRFMLDMYPTKFEEGRQLENPCISPNYYVVKQLKRAYYEKNNLWVDENWKEF